MVELFVVTATSAGWESFMTNFLESSFWLSSKESSRGKPSSTQYDSCNSVAWIATALCLLGILCMAFPDFLNAETPATLTATQSKSLTLNEQGVAAATEQDYPKAEKLLRESLAVDTGNVSAAVNLASVLLALQKTDEAISILEKYKTRAKGDPELLARLGDAYFSKRNIDKALPAYEEALRNDKSNVQLHTKLATIYSMKNNLAASEQHLDKALKLDPSNASLYGNLASIKLANGKIAEAIAHAKRAIQIKPTTGVYVTLGTAYELQDELNNSLIAFERARDLGDDSDELEDKIDEIKERL